MTSLSATCEKELTVSQAASPLVILPTFFLSQVVCHLLLRPASSIQFIQPVRPAELPQTNAGARTIRSWTSTIPSPQGNGPMSHNDSSVCR